MKNVGLSISQWLPCPLVIWAFALDDNLVKYLVKYSTTSWQTTKNGVNKINNKMCSCVSSKYMKFVAVESIICYIFGGSTLRFIVVSIARVMRVSVCESRPGLSRPTVSASMKNASSERPCTV